MKKLGILALCLCTGVAAMAQKALVKEVERNMKSSIENYPSQLEQLKPAFADPETTNDAWPYFVAGKGGMDYFDKLQGYKAIGKQVDDSSTGRALINSFGYLIDAMQRDSVPDKKGKIKPKYSKKAVELIKSHYNDLSLAAVNMWQVKDYNGAYDAWDLFVKLPDCSTLGVNAPAALPDSVVADMCYNMGLAAWQSDRLEDALASFEKSMAHGYTKKNIYDYAIGVSSGMEDRVHLMAKYAAMAQPLYGDEDPNYVGYIINEKIQNKQYGEALNLLEQYIQKSPNNPNLYYVLGMLYESQENPEKAFESYKKSLELDPNNAQALKQYGRVLYNKAITLDDKYSSLSGTEYREARETHIIPVLNQSIEALEKSYQLDPDNSHESLTLLRSIYYMLDDEANLARIEALLI